MEQENSPNGAPAIPEGNASIPSAPQHKAVSSPPKSGKLPNSSVTRNPKIENDLLKRYEQSQAKLRAQRTKHLSKELALSQGTPTINPSSNQSAFSATGADLNIKMTSNLKVAGSLTKRRTVSTVSNALSSSAGFYNNLESPSGLIDLWLNLPKFHVSKRKPPTKDGLRAHSPAKATNAGLEYEFIANHMGSHSELDIPDPYKDWKYHECRKDLFNRTKDWDDVRHAKQDKGARAMAASELDDCTFNPSINYPKNQSRVSSGSSLLRRANSYSQGKSVELPQSNLSMNSRFLATESEAGMKYYQGLSPHKTTVTYQTGFNMKNFLNKAQPLIDYQSVASKH